MVKMISFCSLLYDDPHGPGSPWAAAALAGGVWRCCLGPRHWGQAWHFAPILRKFARAAYTTLTAAFASSVERTPAEPPTPTASTTVSHNSSQAHLHVYYSCTSGRARTEFGRKSVFYGTSTLELAMAQVAFDNACALALEMSLREDEEKETELAHCANQC